jgi:CRP-like cAMP-binding protein
MSAIPHDLDDLVSTPWQGNLLPCGVGENAILAGLQSRDRERLLAVARPVGWPSKKVLYRSHEPVQCVYFITRGVCALVTSMRDGTMLEVGMVGHEGMVGVPAVFGGGTWSGECWTQSGGCQAFAVDAEALLRAMADSAALRERIFRYAQALFAQVTQVAACNGYHSILQRCCRRLLMTQDRMGSNEIRLTHDFLATMLGVRRASVSEVAEQLRAAGVVHSAPGRFVILDRAGLEQRSCECYHSIRTHINVLLS